MEEYVINETDYFTEWLDDLKDLDGKQIIVRRVKQARKGNFGDCRWNIEDGVSEMRIHYGPGYRLYFCQRGNQVYLLLIGGIKKSQTRNLERAKEIKREAEETNKW